MFTFVKKHNKGLIAVIAILIIVGFPIVINMIAICPAFWPDYVAGTGQGVWVNFFAVYSGSLIGALVSFYILSKTIKNNQNENEANRIDNKNENEKNREQLKAVFKYQVDRDVLNTVRQSLAIYVQSLNILELGYIANYPKERVKSTLLEIKNICANAICNYNLLELALLEYEDKREKEFKGVLKQFHYEYVGLINDFGWLLDFYLYNRRECDGKEEVLKYKDKEDRNGFFYNEKKRIWSIIDEGNYNIFEDAAYLMNELLDRLDYSSITDEIKDFIKYEQNKFEETLLKGHN